MTYYIYCISCDDSSLGKYIGSTKNFKVREQLHRSNANCNINREPYLTINSNGGFQKWNVNILEEIETEDKKIVYDREQYWIDNTENKLNKRNAKFDLNAYMRKWYDNNKEKVSSLKKEYYKNNRDKRLAYQSEYNKKKKSNNNINDIENNEIPCEDKEI